ncbi:MAG: NAD(P)H-binding protein, partial [Oscillospiraceae bacterium]|nr:NAD(P)H-binding protein [Oscillospiraceae bacterium]
MKIAVIGAAGKAGKMIFKEAQDRGHDVTAIVRPGSEKKLCSCCSRIVKDLFELSADDLKDFDAVVNAFGSDPGYEYKHIDAAKHLINVFKSLPDVRLLVVGGAGSLQKACCSDHYVIEDIPPMFRSIPVNQKIALEEYKNSDINWTFFSPAATFDFDGYRTGEYVLGGDTQIFNKVGASYISYADYAVAMVDEIENNAHPRQRFTAVSCNPFFTEAKQFFNISRYMFSRRGAWMSLVCDNPKYASGMLFIATNHGTRTHTNDRNYNKLFRIEPTFEGRRVAFSVQTAPDEFTVHTRHGDVRFTFADKTKLMAEGDKGMGLYIYRTGEAHECAKRRKGGAWEYPVNQTSAFTFKGTEGSEFNFNDNWNWYNIRNDFADGQTTPNAEGKFTLVIEEFPFCATYEGNYPTYAEAKASMKADWESFLAQFPKFKAPYDSKREETAYILWTHLVAPTQRTKYELMLMFPGVEDSQWQLVMNGVALQNMPELSLGLILSAMEFQDPEGQLVDMYDESLFSTSQLKPPIHGWAVKNVMRYHDISRIWPKEGIEELYEKAGRWADWFMKYRDDDEDGLPGFEGGGENGFNEVTAYFDTVSLATPDLCAYEVINFEAQGDLAKILGKPQKEIDAWYKKAKDLLDRMVDKMWDGEHFVCLKDYTHEPVFSGSSIHYMPLMLGDRLPKEIIEKMCADLCDPMGINSKFGLATERIDSDFLEFLGVQMGDGTISAPNQLFILTGLWEAGQKDLCRQIVAHYCGRLIRGGFNH